MITILPKLTASLHLKIEWMEYFLVSIWGPGAMLFFVSGRVSGAIPFIFSVKSKLVKYWKSQISQWLVKYDDLARYIFLKFRSMSSTQ